MISRSAANLSLCLSRASPLRFQSRFARRFLSTTACLSSFLPTVSDANRSYDLFSRLHKERVLFLNGPIDDNLSAILVASLLFCESENAEKSISLYINSPGGSVTAGLAIYDTIKFISCPVSTIVLGQASSMASLILSAGQKGQRFALPNSSVMIHQPSGGIEKSQASDISILAVEILRIKEKMFELYADNCSLEEESRAEAISRFTRLLERDYYMTGEAAIKEGIIDSILVKRKDEIKK